MADTAAAFEVLDLFSGGYDVVEDYRRRLAAFRQAMTEDWRAPGTHTVVLTPGAPAGDVREGTRCGRCGEPCMPYALIINHDLGYGGCFGHPGRYGFVGHGADRLDRLADRADRAVYPDCAACGHPWGLHSHNGVLPVERSCLTYCGCRSYTPPSMAASPWGTCPGCWGAPHDGPCPPRPPH